MGLAKSLGRPPREVAQEVVAAVDLEGLASVEIAGPGFLNLTLHDAFLGAAVEAVCRDARLGVPAPTEVQRVALDYSSPGVGKELHVGHLRGTVIGDALARVLRFEGHTVVPRNHLGDWGTPFGMLIEHLCDLGVDASAGSFSVGDLDAFYKDARAKFDSDASFAARSRARVVALQSGDQATRALWRVLVDESIRHFDDVYRLLDIRLQPEDVAGESAYNDQPRRRRRGPRRAGLLVVKTARALRVFPDGFLNREGQPLLLIVRKRDGGYGYAATDLAALRDRTCDSAATGSTTSWARRSPSTSRWSSASRRRPVGTSGRHRRPRRLREHPRPGPQDAEDARGGLPEARRPPARGDRAGRCRAGRACDGLRRGRARLPCRGDRDRCGEVRGPLDRAHARLRVRLGPDAVVRGRHRPVPRLRARPSGRSSAASTSMARRRARASCSPSHKSAPSRSDCCGSARR